MFKSPKYLTDPEEAERFVATMRHGTLVATGEEGHPQVSILPFVKEGDLIELHCVQADATFAAVSANPKVSFLVSDFLAFTPHDWVDPEDGGVATLHFRAVVYECLAEVSTDPRDVASALRKLVATYEPGATYTPIEDGDYYGARLRRLAAIRLQVVQRQAKFKVGPAGPPELKASIAANLRQRAWPGDARAADAIDPSTSGQI